MWKPEAFRKKNKPVDNTALSSDEYRQIIEHVEQCDSCRPAHTGFVSFLEHLPIGENDVVNDEIRRHIESGGLKERFIQRARTEGIHFSSAAANVPQTGRPPAMAFRWVTAAALVALVTVVSGRHFIHWNSSHALPAQAQAQIRPAQPPLIAPEDQANRKLEAQLSELQADADDANGEIAKLQDENTQLALQMSALARDLSSKRAENQDLQLSLAHLRDQNAQQAAQFDTNAQLLAHTQAELEEVKARSKALEAENGAEKEEVANLSQQLSTKASSLSRDRELLAEGRDITDLMGARNLHIIDVRDADGKGKNKESFGRIFYTEGKSLIFYAYDLDQEKEAKADSSFEVWGERLGEPTSVRSLGILYTDSKDQKRWALTVDNPQQLAEIDSLFVTLEHHHGQSKPLGGKILFAFLGGKANHP